MLHLRSIELLVAFIGWGGELNNVERMLLKHYMDNHTQHTPTISKILVDSFVNTNRKSIKVQERVVESFSRAFIGGDCDCGISYLRDRLSFCHRYG